MLRGTEEGFFGPTNQDNAVGAPKHQYCVREADNICRPEFASKNPNCPVSDKGYLSPSAMQLLLEKIRDCCTKDFFDTQISREFVKRCIVNTINAQAGAEGDGFGGNIYRNFEPFYLAEVYKMIGLLFVNGLSPQPRISIWFEGHKKYGNDFIASTMHKQLSQGRLAIQGI